MSALNFFGRYRFVSSYTNNFYAFLSMFLENSLHAKLHLDWEQARVDYIRNL